MVVYSQIFKEDEEEDYTTMNLSEVYNGFICSKPFVLIVDTHILSHHQSVLLDNVYCFSVVLSQYNISEQLDLLLSWLPCVRRLTFVGMTVNILNTYNIQMIKYIKTLPYSKAKFGPSVKTICMTLINNENNDTTDIKHIDLSHVETLVCTRCSDLDLNYFNITNSNLKKIYFNRCYINMSSLYLINRVSDIYFQNDNTFIGKLDESCVRFNNIYFRGETLEESIIGLFENCSFTRLIIDRTVVEKNVLKMITGLSTQLYMSFIYLQDLESVEGSDSVCVWTIMSSKQVFNKFGQKDKKITPIPFDSVTSQHQVERSYSFDVNCQ